VLWWAGACVQVTGDALYTDDIPSPANTLHAALVMSSKAHARVLSVDASKCEGAPGFVRYFGYEDVPAGHNAIGSIVHDEEVFVSTEAKHFGAVSSFCINMYASHPSHVAFLAAVSVS
jgi:xanthine dehydrogenase molybdopterin-binding subunit B